MTLQRVREIAAYLQGTSEASPLDVKPTELISFVPVVCPRIGELISANV